jgi:choline-sulfatase
MHFTPMHADHGFDVMRTSEHLAASAHALRPDGNPDLDDYHQWLVDKGVARWRAFDVGEPPAVDPIRPPDAGTSAFPFRLEYHATTWIEREVRSYLAGRRNERPMFLVISFPHPHAPLNPPQPYASMYDEADVRCPELSGTHTNLPDAFVAAMERGTANYAGWRVPEHGVDALRARLTKTRALIRQIDDSVGHLLELLPLARTLIAFTSDHGDFGGHHGLAGKVPWIPFDDLTRVPLVVAGAGTEGGLTVKSLVQSSDLALTFCDVAGISPPAPLEAFDSVPLTRLLSDDAPDDDERPVFFVSNLGWPGARAGSLKLICHSQSESRAAFDLAEDPGEFRNIADDPVYQNRVEGLTEMIREVMARPMPPLPTYGPRVRA